MDGIGQLTDAAASVWGKSERHGPGWLPLWRHLDDSAAVAGEMWDRWLPTATRRLIAGALPGGDADGRRLAIWLAGIHDLGKATPVFAHRPGWTVPLADRMRQHGLPFPRTHYPDGERRLAMHATAGQVLVERWLRRHGWTEPRAARQFGVVVGGHHGIPPTAAELCAAAERPHLLGLSDDQKPWRLVQAELLDRAAVMCDVADRLPKWQGVRLPQPAQVLLTAMVIVADWIASNEDLFPYDPGCLHSPSRLATAWDALDLPAPWHPVPTGGEVADLFPARFRLPPGAVVRPVQAATVELATQMPPAGLLIIEAPMGEGKTEAALAAVEVLAARTGAGGCFVALPTRATSDAMFARVKDWLLRVPDADVDAGALAINLAHGKARFNDDLSGLMRHGRSSDIESDAPDPQRPGRPRELAAHQWLTGRKKSLLSSFVVGTVDQLLFGALQAKHLALRHLGLASKVVVIDEAHAYDVYMSQYLDRALEWLAAYQVPTIVLSATLPGDRRREMIQAYDRGRGLIPKAAARRSWREPTAAAPLPDPYGILDGDIGYPVLTATGTTGNPTVRVADPSGRATEVTLDRVADDPAAIADLLREALSDGGCALVVHNTVRRVQATAAHLRTAFADTGIDVSVAHSRFLAPDRAEKDQWLLRSFGPPEHVAAAGGSRPAAHIVVASQVAEQSLDIDFDLLITDVAPVDLVLQRAGRLHRHQRGPGQAQRPVRLRTARCVLAGVDWATTPPEPAAGSVRVYSRFPLLRALAVLSPYLDCGRSLHLPADIAPLVQAAYGHAAVGPAEWQDAITAAEDKHQAKQTAKARKALTFRLREPGPDGQAIVGWLASNVGEADDGPEGRNQVRDTGAETVEVVVLVRRADGTHTTPPWLVRDGGREITDHEPPSRLARAVAACTLALPIQLCTLETIEELERRFFFPGLQQSKWLAGELVLVLDERGEAELNGHHLRYDPWDGLTVTRLP